MPLLKVLDMSHALVLLHVAQFTAPDLSAPVDKARDPRTLTSRRLRGVGLTHSSIGRAGRRVSMFVQYSCPRDS